MTDDVVAQLAEAVRAVAEVASRRLLDRIETRTVADALRLADQATYVPPPDPVSDLRQWCHGRGYTVHPLDRVERPVAAEILGLSVGHLKNSPATIPCVHVGRRVLYRLSDLVSALDER